MWIEFLGANLFILLGQWISFQVCFYLLVGMVITLNLSVLVDLKEKKAIKKADELALESAQYKTKRIDSSMIA